jgi:hypothetical protein
MNVVQIVGSSTWKLLICKKVLGLGHDQLSMSLVDVIH